MPILCPTYQLRSQWVGFDVLHELQKVSILFNQERFESALEYVAGTSRPMSYVLALGDELGKCSKKSAQVPILPRSNGKMPVVRHDAERKYIQRKLVHDFFQRAKYGHKIVWFSENSPPGIRAVDDVIDLSRNVNAWLSCHGGSIA